MKSKKIITFENAVSLVAKLKKQNKKVVLCHGVFDLLHIGHIKHFQEAKKFGDVLIVSLTDDKYVNKGSNRPAFNISLREEALAAISKIDYVFKNKWPTAIQTIKFIRPNIYCKGPDYKSFKKDITEMIKKENEAIKSVKGKIKFTKSITFSSSKLLYQFSNIFSEEQKKFLNKVNKVYDFNKLKSHIEKFKKIKVLIIGETIIDEYAFCEALGKSGKESVLVLRNLRNEKYLGGAAAVAAHLSDFCSSVTLLTMLGEKSSNKDFILKNLPKNIKLEYINKDESPTILKKRYVDHVNNNKVLGVYELNDMQLNSNNEKQFEKKIIKLIPKHDLVIVSDYGHGFINKKIANKITSLSSSIALNAQINSSNVGHHSIAKYNKIGCVIINIDELRHELRDKDKNIKYLMKDLSKSRKIENLIVTQGNKGALLYNSKKDSFFNCPAFANKVVDKIGSGDAFLALASLSIHDNYDELLSLYLGSLAACQSVESIGNSQKVNKNLVLKAIKHSIL